MKEIEVKILEINVAKIVARLEAWGAKKIFDGELNVKFFDFPGNILRRNHQTLRLRDRGKFAELTFKHKLPAQKVKVAEENQIRLDNFYEAQEILKGIGMRETMHYIKHRLLYLLENVLFEIDKIEGCPPFLEIEAGSEAEIERWVHRLGYEMSETKAWSGSEVIKYYAGKKL